MENQNIRLCLVMTEGMSFQLWDEYGQLNREVTIYQELINFGVHTTFISFGNKTELKYSNIYKEFDFIYNKWKLPNILYKIMINIFYFNKLRKIDLIKTNQVDSINVAKMISQIFKKPILGRMGYLKSFQKKQIHGENSTIYLNAVKLEKKIASYSSKIILTTEDLKEKFYNYHRISKNKIKIIPNYVDTRIFKPNNQNKKYDLLFVGRLTEQKNIINLVKAVKDFSLKILFIGSGPLKNQIVHLIKMYNLNLKLIDRVPNNKLPSFMNSASIFVQPSAFEGNPKTLLEAMACGLPVIGSNSPGISNLIKHKNNGYICESTINGIKNAINDLASNVELQNKIGGNASKYIQDNYALDLVVEKELKMFNDILN